MYYRKRKRPRFNTTDLVKQFMDKGGEVKSVSPVFGVDKQFDKTLAKFYKSVEWREARDYIFAHNPNECAYCGAVDKLQIDHIRPLRHNWDLRLNIDNLQILCEECNYSKGSNSDYQYHVYHLEHRKFMLEEEEDKKSRAKKNLDLIRKSNLP